MNVRKPALDDIDSRVLQAIEQGHWTLKKINLATSIEERVVDRSLQRLRKQDKIKYMGHGLGWSTT